VSREREGDVEEERERTDVVVDRAAHVEAVQCVDAHRIVGLDVEDGRPAGRELSSASPDEVRGGGGGEGAAHGQVPLTPTTQGFS